MSKDPRTEALMECIRDVFPDVEDFVLFVSLPETNHVIVAADPLTAATAYGQISATLLPMIKSHA